MFGLSRKKLKILIYGNKLLKKPSEPITTINHDLFLLGQQLIDTMNDADGLGLAAPQVGINKRLIALGIPTPKNADTLALSPGEVQLLPLMPMVLVNPEIISFGTTIVENEEGCLSVPDIYAPVQRPERIMLRAQILGGELVTLECGGLLARALQHEIDHLDGILFIEKVSQDELVKVQNKLDRLLKSKPLSKHK